MKKVLLLFCLILITGSVTKAQVNVTFKVDMIVYQRGNSFNPTTDTVRIAGDFNGWSTTANNLTKGTGADSAVYSAQISGVTAGSHSYKFIFIKGGSVNWEDDPNRSVTIGTNDTTLAAVLFNRITGKLNNVWFKVDMGQEISLGHVHPATDTVVATGDFTNWPDWDPRVSGVRLTYNSADSVYSGLADSLASGSTIKFKYVYLNGNINWESISDRSYFVPEADSTTFSAYWNNIDPSIVLVDGNILFVVDMSVANELGVFNPSVDSVQIRGAFNGWNASDPPRSLMNQDVDPNVWFLDIPMIQYQLNSTGFYKYFINNPGTPEIYANEGWEVAINPTTSGNRDRPVVFQGSPTQAQEYQWFEGILTDWVVPSGTTLQAKFSVDMAPATDFNPTTDSVVWIPKQPFYYAVHNIPWPGDYPKKVLYLTDANSDMIYEGTLTINGPDFNGFLYNYGYVDVSASNALVQEGGSQEECRVRYIGQTGPRAFVNPYNFPQDVWTPSGQKPEEIPPVSVKEIPGGIPNVYTLEQNYPNPFNPSTTIRFSIPEAGIVNLSIYNLLGEKVAEVLNHEFVTGSYEFIYDASSLSSGVYFYTIKANDYVATKKMLFLK